MPSYIVTCEEGRLTELHKIQIAEAITRAHGDLTGAPYYFVQLTFNEVKPGNYFLGGTQLDSGQIFVHGTIRDGRPTEMSGTRSGFASSRRWRMARQAPMFCGSSCAHTSSRRFG